MRWETGTAGARRLRMSARYLSALMLLGIAGLTHAQSPAPCSPALGRIVSLQGSVELLRPGSGLWERLTRLDTPLCQGDRLRAGLLSRAAMYISPETIVRLDQNTTLEVVEQTESETILRFHQDDLTHALAAQSNFCGIGYFITRFPRKLRVRTPFYNAVVEGTEFQVAMTCDRGELAVFEGRVAAESVTASGERVLVEAGQSTSVGIGETPSAIKALVKPADAVQWALYYLPLTDVSLLTAEALAQDCGQLSAALRSGCVIRRAEYLLRVGRAREARAELADLLAIEPNNGDVLALEAIIAVVQNDKEAALDLAQRAVTAAPNAFRPYAALSYAQQAHFKLDESFDAAKRAAELAPDSALLRARTAELQLSLGRVRSAEREAVEAVRLNPNESRAHLILGFVHLAQIDTKRAAEDFLRAIELDSTEPLARLGLGLATIREGRLQEGREQIEIAVALDPTNSLVRSYVGKAYYEENTTERDRLAATQFGLAKALDPNDPTPWFYDAILKQTQNRPVEALEDLEKSIELNDNRAVYRSKLALDQDRASRALSSAHAYNVLGLERYALTVASDSLLSNPSSSGAHRFLSQMFGQRERHEVARASEVLQYQLLQPLNSAPLSPRLSTADLSVPQRLSDAAEAWDYDLLFERTGPRLQVLGGLGNDRSWMGEGVVSVLGEKVLLSAGGYSFSTEGFRPNNDADHDLYNLFLQISPSPTVSFQAEYRDRRTVQGDLELSFDPDYFSPDYRQRIDQQTWRFGATAHPTSDGTFILSAISSQLQLHESQLDPGVVSADIVADDDGELYEAQYQHRMPSYNIVVGAGYSSTDTFFQVGFDWTPLLTVPCLDPDFPCVAVRDVPVRQVNSYVYVNLLLAKWIDLTLGASYDEYKDRPVKVDGVHPKLGVQFSIGSGISMRFAYFEALKRQLVVDQTVEPTQIMGFNQLYDDVNGSETRTMSAALDYNWSSRLLLTSEWQQRRVDIRTGLFGGGLELIPTQRLYEESVHLDGSYLLSPQLSMLAGASYETFKWDPGFFVPSPTRVRTSTVRLGARFFDPSGVYAFAQMNYVDQFVRRLEGITVPSGQDSFLVVDGLIGYRFPRRRGSVTLEARNIFNEEFYYQDENFRSTETRSSPYIPSRQIWLRAALSF